MDALKMTKCEIEYVFEFGGERVVVRTAKEWRLAKFFLGIVVEAMAEENKSNGLSTYSESAKRRWSKMTHEERCAFMRSVRKKGKAQ